MVELTSQERFEIWDQFIERWPIEKLRTITLEEYNTLGSKDSSCYWLKKRPKIWVLFGAVLLSNLVFLSSIRTQKNAKDEGAGFLKSDKYKWLKKYGKSASEA